MVIFHSYLSLPEGIGKMMIKHMTFQHFRIYIYTIIISSFSDNPGVSWGVYIFCQRQVRKSWTSRNWEFTNTVDFFLNRSWSSTNDMGLEPALLRGSNTSDICFKSMFLSNHRRIWTSTRGCSGRKIGGDASPWNKCCNKELVISRKYVYI